MKRMHSVKEMTGFILARFLQSLSFIQRRQMAFFTLHKKPRSLVESADLFYAYSHILHAHALKTPVQRANVIPRACVTLIQRNAYGQRTPTRNHKILVPVYSEIRCIALRVLQTSKRFWVFLFRQSF